MGIVIGTLLLTAAYARTGWYYVFPLNVRLVWLVIFTPFTALGFWIGLHEAQMLPQQRGAQIALDAYWIVPFLPVYPAHGSAWITFRHDRQLSRIDHSVACACLWQLYPITRPPPVDDSNLHGLAALLWLILPQSVLF